jgi:hypothetical protein
MATLYWAVYPSGDTNPTAAQIIAQATSGHFYGSDTAPGTTGVFDGTAITGLTASTSYKLAVVWDDGVDTSVEAYSDAFSTTAAGVSGSLVAQEAGSDTFSSSGSVAIEGSLTAQETGADTLAASGSVLVSGSLVAQEAGSDTFSAIGTTLGSTIGSMAAQETGADTLPRKLTIFWPS